VYSPWSEPTFADSTVGDDISGEDLTVRRAAVQALGRYNGSVVAVNPLNGRVLSMVNQRLALQSGFQPCSTVKLPVAVAGLVENVIERDTPMRIYGSTRLTLTEALARSNNQFFALLGSKLGFERFSYYARLLGLGERAGLNIEGERLGAFPEAPPRGTSVGIMSSFGEGISVTPLQLAAMISAFANGGTLYYLQYPRSLMEVRDYIPQVKRRLDIERWLPDLTPGMSAAVAYGTARRANYDPSEPVLGKTGTCTENRTHLGWFGSFNSVGHNRLVVVVLLTGGQGVSGPAAAEIAGNMYKRLSMENFFAENWEFSPTALVSTQSCCAQ
jgi:cell division protein FtsI/penicillin-binding protein 2